MKVIEIYTDGSCLKNPGGPGGWCSILKYKEHEKIISGNEDNTTNNRMELLAVIKALEILKEPVNIKLYSDSQYVLKSISEWLPNWIKKDFKNIKNADLWKNFISISKNHNINTIWIKGHSGHKYNEKCDKIAYNEAIKLKNDNKLNLNC